MQAHNSFSPSCPQIEALESRQHMDVSVEGFLGGGNSAVHLEVSVIGAGGQDSAFFAEVRLPSGKVLTPTDPCVEALIKSALPPNPI